MEPAASDGISLKSLLVLALVYQALALGVLAVTGYLVWNQQDWTILYVPLPVWQWSLLGAVVGVLYRLAFQQGIDREERRALYTWAIAKPFVGTALGGVIYFLAAAGMLALNGSSNITNIQLLCAVSFLAAFSDRFSGRLLEGVMGSLASMPIASRRNHTDGAPTRRRVGRAGPTRRREDVTETRDPQESDAP